MDRLRRVARQLEASPVSSQMTFQGDVVVVTGGAQGIGAATARALASKGAQACIFDMDGGAAQRAAEALRAEGFSASGYLCDVTSEASVQEAFGRVLADFGKIDVLVQAAGITGKTNIKTHEVDPADFDRVFRVNSTGIFLCARAVLPSMLAKNYGRIVNIASISGKEGNAGMLAYSASKAAVIGATKVMGKEYAETGITVNAVAPAVVKTKLVEAMPEEQVKYMTDKIPMKRCGTTQEIADLVCFIASREASFTTAFTFDATGGRATY